MEKNEPVHTSFWNKLANHLEKIKQDFLLITSMVITCTWFIYLKKKSRYQKEKEVNFYVNV